MRAFVLFCTILLGCLVAGALLAYPAYLLAHAIDPDWRFHRVASRVAMLLLVIALIWLFRHLHVNDRVSLGYNLDRRSFLRWCGLALGLGAGMMLPVVGLLYALDVRVLHPKVEPTLALVGSLVFQGLLTGLAVAFLEETLLRGAVYTAIERESGPRTAVLLTALVYSALHFLNKTRIPHDQVDWSSGLDLLSGALGSFANPLALADSFLALFAVGALLGLVRLRTGNIAACIGLHAGWVWVIAITRELTTYNPDSEWSFLAGTHDGLVGWLIFTWTVAAILVYRAVGRAGRTQVPDHAS